MFTYTHSISLSLFFRPWFIMRYDSMIRDGGRGLGMFAQTADSAQRWRSGKIPERSEEESSCGQLLPWPNLVGHFKGLVPATCSSGPASISQIRNRGFGLVCGGNQRRLVECDDGNPHTSCTAESSKRAESSSIGDHELRSQQTRQLNR